MASQNMLMPRVLKEYKFHTSRTVYAESMCWKKKTKYIFLVVDNIMEMNCMMLVTKIASS